MTSEHDDFWGGSADWPTAQNPIHSDAADATGSTPRSRITGRHRLSGFLDRGAAPTREHRVADAAQAPAAAAGAEYAYGDEAESFDWDFDDDPAPVAASPTRAAFDEPDAPGAPAETDAPDWGDEWAVAEPRSRAAMIDPLLARVGAVVVAITLAVPLILSLRPDGDPDTALREAEAEAADPSVVSGADTILPDPSSILPDSGGAESTAPAGTAPGTAATTDAATPSDPATTVSSVEATSTEATSIDDGDQIVSAMADDAPADTAVACALEYEVVAGDFWLRLAEGAGVPLDDLLAVNGASSGTALYPGSTVCLPAGASTPPAPPAPTAAPTTAAPTTAAPTTAAPTTAAPTTAAPTTAAPTTAAPDPSPPPATGTVEEIIRAVWPDELEDKAIQIAWRESNHQPDVRNYCCIGLFQIYWEVHQGWLSDLGITTLDDLFDAETNARAAYALYQRAGGWGPWGG